MSSPVSNTTNFLFNTEFEDVGNIVKEEVQATFEKTSSQAKEILKKQANDSVEVSVPYTTFPVKTAIAGTFPVPVAVSANASLDVCVDTAIKKVAHKSIDKFVDTAAKKAINDSVDYSVNSSKSYSSVIYDYIQSKFA